MKSCKKRLIILFSLFVLFSLSLLSAQETLSKYNTSWISVLPGTALCKPEVTSYGYCLATDARNIMGYSSSGKLLWEKNTGRVRNLSLTVLSDDFVLFHDKDKNLIRLYNPSGTEIWSKVLDFKLFGKPFDGRDGRFFIYGERTLICMGINGIEKWKLETEYQKDLPMQELPDGSVILFLNDEGGKTRGLRISPFGEELEKITFSGSIKTSASCKDGVLLTFSDGSAGLFSLKDGLAESRWVASVKSGNSVFVVNKDHSEYRLLSLSSNDVTAYKLRSEDGSVEGSHTLNNINGNALLLFELSESGLFIADSKKAVLIDYDFAEVWSAVLPESVRNKTVNHLVYLEDDYLVLCSKNWSMDAYHTRQTTSSRKNTNVSKSIHPDYSSFVELQMYEINYYNQGAFLAALKSPERINEMKSGNYGKKEKEWLSQTLSIAKLYAMDNGSSDFGTRMEKSVFQTDTAGFENILVQLALLGTSQSQNAAAEIISSSTNKTYCRALLSNICGYDPDGKLLDAIERNALHAGTKDSVYLNTICDTVYSICLFMGRPAWNKKGKDILKNFMGAGYSFNTRNYARDTLKKIIALEL